ncbi:hypothetical protein NP493_1421g01033 [Ridgeia piscesae]|uniref:Uncharacterized protein n=1 Tax=Ridgeia piscesae TaxID=27915 RepID=A0AAD9ND91_RIDPI|nr:hypothetical protein NP493_1421g01033 [Ridgeia piscesae]
MKEAARDTPRLWLVMGRLQRPPGQPLYTDDVQGLERQLVDLKTALDRAKTRHPERVVPLEVRSRRTQVGGQPDDMMGQVRRLTITMQREAESESH